MIGVLHILSQVLGGLAFALLVPVLIALVTGDGALQSFLLVSGLTGFLSGAIYFALQGRKPRFDRQASFVLVVALWIVLPLIAAVPFALRTDIGYAAAFFEATSGLTTTGATIFPSLSVLGPATIFWRAELQWLGGLATLVTFVTILAPAGLGGLSSRGLASIGGFSDAGPDRIVHGLRHIVTLYALFTGLCIILLFFTGIPTFDAICLSLAAISTGGFMPVDGDLSVYANPYADGILTIFMALGATSILWHRLIFEGRRALLLEHRETYWVIAVMLIVGVIYAWNFAGIEGLREALGEGFFNGVSLVSTTGFETRPGGLAAIPDTLVIFLAIAGGAALSPAGGLKFYRIGAMTVQSIHELRRLIFPHSVRSTKFGSQPYDLALMKAIWANLVVSLGVIMFACLMLSLRLPGFDAAMVAAVSAFANIGPLYSPEWQIGPHWPAYSDFGVFSQLVMAATMILGRIEVIVLFAAMNVAYWRS